MKQTKIQEVIEMLTLLWKIPSHVILGKFRDLRNVSNPNGPSSKVAPKIWHSAEFFLVKCDMWQS